MDRFQFWINFKLCEELHISGRFLYSGLQCLHDLEHIHYEDAVFEVLYNLSVGLERLLKIAVILIEHDDSRDREELERSLITHNHLDLLARVRRVRTPALHGPHNAFLQMLSTFYKSHRYGRYGTTGITANAPETDALHHYIETRLNMKLNDATENSPRIRRFLGKIVGKIAAEVYEIIRQEAGRRGLYTFELRADSKADKIFVRKEYDFTHEDILWKELLVFFVHWQGMGGHLGLMQQLEPLAFDPALAVEYLQCIGSNEKKLGELDELESLYDAIDERGKRLTMISALGDPCVSFGPSGEDAGDA
ncbi:MAG: hypothetical protein ACYC35_07935 [Pirellulales bacterium]